MNRSKITATAAALSATFALGACGDGELRSKLETFDSTLSQNLETGLTVEFDLESYGVHVRQTSSSVTCTGPNGRSASYDENSQGGELKLSEHVHTILPYNVDRVDQLVLAHCAGEDIQSVRQFVALVDNPASAY